MSSPQTHVQELYQRAVAALNRGDWLSAHCVANQLLPLADSHAGVHFVAGVAALGMRALQPALQHLEQAVWLNPDRTDYRAQLARAWCSHGHMRQAHEVAIAAVRLPLLDGLSANTLGVVFVQANDHLRAVDAFETAVRHVPGNAMYHFNLATALTFTGRLELAERELEACLALSPRYWKAHLALAQLWKQTPQSNHLDRLRALLMRYPRDDEAQLHLNIALSRELEDLGQYGQALTHLMAGKSVLSRTRPYQWRRDRDLFEGLLKAFSDLDSPRQGHASEEPIFVIGMPRSGTTLVERILSSHPAVHSAGELNNFPIAVRRSCSEGGDALLDAEVLRQISATDWLALGRAYVDSTRPGTGHTPHFIDKLPHNFQYVGYILHALPRAKIVCLQREPMDTCLGNFRQLFAIDSPHYDYSFDLLDVGRYYLMFERLMQGWEHLYPGRIHTLRYEALVQDQETTTRALLQYCGLEWDPRCLAFHENSAPSATASTVQVREPLHARFQGLWRRYGEGLDPLRALLEEGLDTRD